MRDAAIRRLRHWIGRRARRTRNSDFLMNVKKFKEREAVTAMRLLLTFPTTS
jgi:hypothetical protein